MNVFIGQDPGITTGGIAIIVEDHLTYFMTPVKKNGEIDLLTIATVLLGYAKEIAAAGGGNLVYTVEDVHALPLSSAGSNFSFGRRRGEPDALAAAVEVICSLVHDFGNTHLTYYTPKAKEWQKAIVGYLDKVYTNNRVDTKASSIRCAMRLFPQYTFTKPQISKRQYAIQDGLTDATLICEYGRRKFLGLI